MSGLRIIGGTFRGRRLLAPPGRETRPLPDRVKQALFDWLGQRLDGLVVVDCCAGSGAFAFEALSRGAARVDAIEPGRHAVPVLRTNAEKLGNPPGFVLHPEPLAAVLPRLRDVDLIFADPPFAWYGAGGGRLAELLDLAAPALAPGGRLVVLDFERIEGRSRPWVLEHVRAGKDVTRAEIEAGGFELVREHAVAGLAENYVLEFRKPAR